MSGGTHLVLRDVRCNRGMTAATRIYKHSVAGTDWSALLLGGGLGITPIRALMDEFNGGAQIDVIFRASREEDLVLKAEMDYLANNSDGSIRIHYLVGSRTNHPDRNRCGLSHSCWSCGLVMRCDGDSGYGWRCRFSQVVWTARTSGVSSFCGKSS